MKYGLKLFLIVSILSLCSLAKAGDFYVSPDGDDTNKGDEAHPFATLSRARESVRRLKNDNKNPIQVWIRGGHYEVEDTIVFGKEDSGSEGAVISYQAYPNEVPVFSAGRRIHAWNKPKKEIKGLPEVSKGKVLIAKVDEPFRALFDQEGILQRARSPVFIAEAEEKKNKLKFPINTLKNYSKNFDMELWVRPHHAWIVNILPIKNFDFEERVVTTRVDATYPMNFLHFLKTTPNAWVENVIEELDEEGEWVYDKKSKLVYLWPRNNSTVYHSRLDEIIRVEGEIDFGGARDTPVKYIHFSGLTFKHGERYQLNADDKGLQHDWDMLDKPNSLVRFRGAEHCKVKNCHFLHSGSGAVRIDLHGQNNEISGNHIEHMGGAGILLAGYGPGTKDVNHSNLISNNHIHHVGEIYWHSPGIMVWQSGQNRVSNNFVHHTNYTAIIISGCPLDFFTRQSRELALTLRRSELPSKSKITTYEQAKPYLHTYDNLIELNEISHAMQKMGDGNAIYIRGSGPNNVIRKNYIHHLVSPMVMQCAIRTDGGQKDTVIRENIIYKCTSQGMMLKLNNKFENNIVADIIAPPRGYYISLREGPLTGAVIKNNIFFSSNDVEKFISELRSKNPDKTEDRRGRLVARIEDADVGKNIYYSVSAPKKARRLITELMERESSNGSLAVDPQFTDPANGDFTLKPNSPALRLGFIAIDQSEIGLLK